jgi:hypothetical protein
MSINESIRVALMKRVDTFAATPQPPIAWPGEPFKPPAKGPYLEAQWFPNGARAPFVDYAATTVHQGILQVSVCAPAGRGALADATRLADDVADHFAEGTVAEHEGVSVRIDDPPSIAAALIGDGWIKVPVSVRYVAFV